MLAVDAHTTWVKCPVASLYPAAQSSAVMRRRSEMYPVGELSSGQPAAAQPRRAVAALSCGQAEMGTMQGTEHRGSLMMPPTSTELVT